MRSQVRCHAVLGLFLLLQLAGSETATAENEGVTSLQSKVEQLIEKILTVIQEYYHQVKTEYKCIPDDVPDKIIDTLKSSIDCVEENEKKFDQGLIEGKEHKKNFLRCFAEAKKEVETTIGNIDVTVDHCPDNMTEKTYQINVTTTYTKTFHIHIQNGLEISRKTIQLKGKEKSCLGKMGDAEEVGNDRPEEDEHDDDGKDHPTVYYDDDEDNQDDYDGQDEDYENESNYDDRDPEKKRNQTQKITSGLFQRAQTIGIDIQNKIFNHQT